MLISELFVSFVSLIFCSLYVVVGFSELTVRVAEHVGSQPRMKNTGARICCIDVCWIRTLHIATL